MATQLETMLVAGRRTLTKTEKQCTSNAAYASLVGGKWDYFTDSGERAPANKRALDGGALGYLSKHFDIEDGMLTLKEDDDVIPRKYKLFDAGMVLLASETPFGDILWGVTLVREPQLYDGLLEAQGFRRVDISIEKAAVTDHEQTFNHLFYATCVPNAPNAMYSYASHMSLRFFVTSISTELVCKSLLQVSANEQKRHYLPAFLRSTHELPIFALLALSEEIKLKLLVESMRALYDEFTQYPHSQYLFITACNDPDVLEVFVNKALNTFGNIAERKMDAESAAQQKAFADIRMLAITNVRQFFSRSLDSPRAVEYDIQSDMMINEISPTLSELAEGKTKEEKDEVLKSLFQFLKENKYTSEPAVFCASQRIHAIVMYGMLTEPRAYIPIVQKWAVALEPPKAVEIDKIPQPLSPDLLQRVIEHTATLEKSTDVLPVLRVQHQLLVTAARALDPEYKGTLSIDDVVDILLEQKLQQE